jgi:NADH-quinone oxidoreductase subunit A
LIAQGEEDSAVATGLAAYTPVLLIMALALGLVILLTSVSIFLGPHRPSASKLAPYECGIVPVTQARQRFPVKFYLMAMLFIVFDIEAIFLYPWAVWLKHLKGFGFEEMLVFIAVLGLGLLYIYRKGVLEWD